MTEAVQSTPTGKLTFGSVFKLVFWANAAIWVLLALIALLLAFVSPEMINVNGKQAHTLVQALPAVPIILIAGGIFSALGAALGAVLLKVFGAVLPLGAIEWRE